MEPIGKITLTNDLDNSKRLGDIKRKYTGDNFARIEKMLVTECPMTITCDIRPIHPPYFREFCYFDTMGGVSITTLSAEITQRMAIKASKTNTTDKFPLGKLIDKYQLNKSPKKYRKVIFLCGSNYVDVIDQSKLQQLMHCDDEWVIKLHPLTNDDTIRSLASNYGYHRLIDRKISGMDLLINSEYVATLSTSELYIVARLMDKPVTDITRYDRSWLTCYGHLVSILTNTSEDARLLNNCLMSHLSGHLRPEYPDDKNQFIMRNYYSQAMIERDAFKMITNQKLIVADKTFTDWK